MQTKSGGNHGDVQEWRWQRDRGTVRVRAPWRSATKRVDGASPRLGQLSRDAGDTTRAPVGVHVAWSGSGRGRGTGRAGRVRADVASGGGGRAAGMAPQGACKSLARGIGTPRCGAPDCCVSADQRCDGQDGIEVSGGRPDQSCGGWGLFGWSGHLQGERCFKPTTRGQQASRRFGPLHRRRTTPTAYGPRSGRHSGSSSGARACCARGGRCCGSAGAHHGRPVARDHAGRR